MGEVQKSVLSYRQQDMAWMKLDIRAEVKGYESGCIEREFVRCSVK